MKGSPATSIIDFGIVAVIGRMRVASPPANSASGGNTVVFFASGTGQYIGCSGNIVMTPISFKASHNT